MKIKIRKRGQVTLPKKLRDRYGLVENSSVVILPLGSGLILTKSSPALEQLQQAVQKELIDGGVTLQEMLDDLKVIRRQYNAEHYGITTS